MSAVTADTENHKFWLSAHPTNLQIGGGNQIHLVNFDEESGQFGKIDQVAIFDQVENGKKLDEIFELKASPYDADVFAVSHTSSLAVYKCSDKKLRRLVEINTTAPLSSIQWQDIEAKPDGSGDELLASSRQAVLLFDMNTS